MQSTSSDTTEARPAQPIPGSDNNNDINNAQIAATAPGGHKVIRRNGKVTPFDASKIELALTKAFLNVEGSGGATSSRIRETVKALTEQVARGAGR